jgi:hypothetical protein
VYQWTAPAAGTYIMDTAGSAFDTLLSVRWDCTSSELACNDDFPSLGLQSQVTVTLDAGQTVIIIVDGSGGASGTYNLNISAPPIGTPTPTPTPPPPAPTATPTDTPVPTPAGLVIQSPADGSIVNTSPIP